MKKAAYRLELSDRLFQQIRPSAGLENNLNFMLETVGCVVNAPAYAFYVLEEGQRGYVLKAIRHREGALGRVGPSYSGLAAGGKEVYHPPLQLPLSSFPQKTGLMKEGEVPLIVVPLEGGKGLVRLGPITKLPTRQKRMLDYLAGLLSKLFNMLNEGEQVKQHADVIVTSGQALHHLSAIALDPQATMSKMLSMAAVALKLDAGCIIVADGSRHEAVCRFGWSGEAERDLANGGKWLPSLFEWFGDRDVVVLRPGDPRPAGMPKHLSGKLSEFLIINRIPLYGRHGLLICSADGSMDEDFSEAQLVASVTTIANGISGLTRVQTETKRRSHSYAELLKMLSASIDNLNPYTIGYSELMSRYSIIIAQEMGLTQPEIQDIALAAYLSNIGVLGLSEELYLKEGKFTDAEFEKMKLHAEVGAAIVEMTLGNKAVAASIRHHHERMDGNGYPNGLKGREIPVGARIIAVVQTFLAKMNGRKYRDPLDFEKALELLRASGGTQLDSNMVEALIRWFKRKQSSPDVIGKSLGPCREMCCVPEEICANCPAYGREDVNCWDIAGNHCLAHGKSCRSCIVRTEAASRAAGGNMKS